MKSEYGIRKSAEARLKKANELAFEAESLTGEMLDNGFDPKAMRRLREVSAELAQAVHEYNAYRNVVDTEDAAKVEFINKGETR